MVLSPFAKAIPPDAVPEVTGVPFTVTVALGSCVVGVTVTDVVMLLTVAVYVVVLPLVPVLVRAEGGVSAIVLSNALFDNRVTTVE